MKYGVLVIAALIGLTSCGTKALQEELGAVKGDLAKIRIDTDKDGVPDYMDKESTTPAGSLVDGAGRALDLDGDGIRHEVDLDPFSQRGVSVDASGIEKDSDMDGVADSKDLEPDTRQGALVNFQGKHIETAGVSMKVAEAFIPEVSFATNSVTISLDQETRLLTVARMLRANPSLRLRVVGHADKTGSERVNLKIAERRANAVAKVLVNTYMVSESRLEVVSMGEVDPISRKNQHNRRVEFQFIR